MDREQNLPRRAVEFYAKGLEAFQRDNYDYAIALFLSALNSAPDFVKARHTLRLVEFKKLENSTLPIIVVKILSAIMNIHWYVLGLIHFQQGKWIKAMEFFEKPLKTDPKNSFLLCMIARAADNNGMIETAAKCYENALEASPKNIAVLKEYGECCKANSYSLDRARYCYESILRQSPKDSTSLKGLKDLAALGTIQRGGLEDTSTYRDKIRDESQAEMYEKEAKAVRSKEDLRVLIADREKRLSRQPDNVGLHRDLALLYVQAEDFDRAINLYTAASNMAPDDVSLRKSITDAEAKKIDKTISELNKFLAQDPDNTKIKKDIQVLAEKKRNLLLENCKARVVKYPSDLTLRFEMGILYYENGLIDDAVKEFQLAIRNPHKKVQSLNYLGLCFKVKKMHDLAIEQFQKAAEGLEVMDRFKKEVIYNLAEMYEALGKFDAALDEYKKIFEVDISFKDVAKKMEEAYKKGRSG